MAPNQRPWTLLLSWSSCNGSSIIMIMVVVMMVVIAVVLLYHDYGDSVLIKIIMPLQCDLDNTKKQSYAIVLEYYSRID